MWSKYLFERRLRWAPTKAFLPGFCDRRPSWLTTSRFLSHLLCAYRDKRVTSCTNETCLSKFGAKGVFARSSKGIYSFATIVLLRFLNMWSRMLFEALLICNRSISIITRHEVAPVFSGNRKSLVTYELHIHSYEWWFAC